MMMVLMMMMMIINIMLTPFYHALIWCYVNTLHIPHSITLLITLITTLSWCYYYPCFILGIIWRHGEVNLPLMSLLISGLDSDFVQVWSLCSYLLFNRDTSCMDFVTSVLCLGSFLPPDLWSYFLIYNLR